MHNGVQAWDKVNLITLLSEPYTKILLDTDPESPGELYIDIRSVLNLTCAVYSPEVPAAIFWKHNGKVKKTIPPTIIFFYNKLPSISYLLMCCVCSLVFVFA